MDRKPILGVIGGSGLYAMEGLEDVKEHQIDTPFGDPSSPIVIGDIQGKTIAFLARHGIGHVLSPSEVNYRANIFALKSLGIERVLSISACGSLREDYAPGDIVIPDQLFDFTKERKRSFFGDKLVAHISIADPFCHHLSDQVLQSVKKVGGQIHQGGTFITIEGPRFSTRAESNTFRAWGMSIIGMTTSPEAYLAREAEMCYSVMAHVTDYDVWHVTEEPVTVEIVIRILLANTELAQKSIAELVSSLDHDRNCDCGVALQEAIITNRDFISPQTRERLGILVDKYLS
ncbi:MAG: S-methyl-5'-thioadenosine phosphorylase [Anaerolineales bacterium]|nr:S-methyl-5'-thioadenosine phosphorylase [Anaerolineales bacterium]